MAFASSRNICERHRRMFPEVLFHLRLGDSVPRHDLRIFYAQRHERRSSAKAADIDVTHAVKHGEHLGKRRKRLLTATAGRVNGQKAIDAEHRDSTVLSSKPHLHVIGLPRAFLLIFTEAHGVFPGPAERRTIRIARKSSTEGDENQADRPSDRGIGAIAGSEDTGVTVDFELLADWTIDELRRPDVAGGCLHAIE